jgi:hypothetical protein
VGVTGYWGFTGAIYPLGDEPGEFDLCLAFRDAGRAFTLPGSLADGLLLLP